MIEKKPLHMNFIVGSATTFLNKDPSWNIVKMDVKTALPTEFYTYHADIPEANKNDKPNWQMIFNYTDYFGLKNLSPAEFMQASERILFNETAGRRYRDFRYVNGPPSKTNETCDYECRKHWHCETSSGDYDEIMFCHDWDKRWYTNPDYTVASIFDHLVPNWFEKVK
jgi:hypothetical protein